MRGELSKRKSTLVIKHDVLHDLVTIGGVTYNGDFFRAIGAAGVLPSRPFRIHRDKDGIVVLVDVPIRRDL